MDKEKIMNQLQQKMSKHYLDVEVVEYLGCLALKAGDKIIAHFRDWDADHYYTECGPNYTEWALSNGILLEFYKEGKKLLKKPIKKYAIKVFKGKYSETLHYRYFTVERESGLPLISSKVSDDKWQTEFTEPEIEELKARDDIAIDWDKAELEEVDYAE